MIAQTYTPRRLGPDDLAADPGLRNLLGDLGEEEFVAQHWPDRFYLVHGPAGRLQDVFPATLDALLQLPCSGMNAFMSLDDGATEGMQVGPGQVMPLYRAGFTLYFHDLRSPAFEPLVSAMERRLGLNGGRTRISAFASLRGRGVATHYDVNDNFVIQLRGRKRWRLATSRSADNPTVGYRVDRAPTLVHEMEAGGRLPTELPDDHLTFDLEPGSVAFVPRGYLHQCETVDDESLHLNVQTSMLTISDLIAYVFKAKLCPSAPELRARMCGGFRDGHLSESAQQALRAEFQRLGERTPGHRPRASGVRCRGIYAVRAHVACQQFDVTRLAKRPPRWPQSAGFAFNGPQVKGASNTPEGTIHCHFITCHDCSMLAAL